MCYIANKFFEKIIECWKPIFEKAPVPYTVANFIKLLPEPTKPNEAVTAINYRFLEPDYIVC